MTTKTAKKFVPEASTLQGLTREVGLLRSFVIGVAGEDTEGAYRPEFVEEMLRVGTDYGPVKEFRNAKSFLAGLRKK